MVLHDFGPKYRRVEGGGREGTRGTGSQGRVLSLQKYVRGNYGRVLQRGRVDPHDASKCVRGSAQGGEGSAKNEDKITAFFSFAFPDVGPQTFVTAHFQTILESLVNP